MNKCFEVMIVTSSIKRYRGVGWSGAAKINYQVEATMVLRL
jgi:hypothetical protein